MRDGQFHRTVEHAEKGPAGQHESERDVTRAFLVDRGHLQLGHESWPGRTLPDHLASRTS